MIASSKAPGAYYSSCQINNGATSCLQIVKIGSSPAKPKLLDPVRHTLPTKHYGLRIEKSYINWIKQYIP